MNQCEVWGWITLNNVQKNFNWDWMRMNHKEHSNKRDWMSLNHFLNIATEWNQTEKTGPFNKHGTERQ